MDVSAEQIGRPIMAADSVFAVMKKDKKGIFLGFYINPEDVGDEMLRVNLGDVLRVFVTVPDLGA